MATKTFKQYDSRWGRNNYDGRDSMSAAGCGPTACACIIYNVDTKITPWKCAQYMKKHGYAVRGSGTAWAGIPACLKYYGMKNVQNIPRMTDIFNELAKKRRCAVFLFRGGTRGGVTWTTGGHFLAVSGYKVKDSKHYFKMHDPGQRDHDGWYCYETKMRGLILQVWTCSYDNIILVVPKATLKKGDINDEVVKLQECLNRLNDADLDTDGNFGNLTKAALIEWEKSVGIENATGTYGKKCQKIVTEKVNEYNAKNK